MESIHVLEIIGTSAFSVAGAFAAMTKKLDIFGIFIMAFVTALGGGTLRDVLIGEVPVRWLLDFNAGLIVFFSTVASILFRNIIKDYHNILLFFDSVGVGFFTVVGIRTGIALDFHSITCIALGTITACFGGVIRDISLSNIPLIFEKEIYAMACVLGGVVFYAMFHLDASKLTVDLFCLVTIVAVRLLSVRFNWRLPTIFKASKS